MSTPTLKYDPVHLTELLAFELLTQAEPDKTREALAHRWRESGELREEYRARVGVFNEALKNIGLKVHVSQSAKIQPALVKLITVPPRVAYEL